MESLSRKQPMHLEQSTKKYHANHSMVYSCQYHGIFCPKYRRKVLHPPLDTRLKELILEKQEAYGYRVLGMDVMPDPVFYATAVLDLKLVRWEAVEVHEDTNHVEAIPQVSPRAPEMPGDKIS